MKYNTITSYIDELAAPSPAGTWIVDKEHTGEPGDPIQFPFVSYSINIHAFLETMEPFMDRSYGSTLEGYGIEWSTESMSSYDVSDAPEDCILALITAAIRADRFCEGALLGFFENGSILKWLERLREIDEGR